MSTSFIAKSHLIFALTAALFAVTLLAVGPSFATEVPTNALCPVTPDEPVDPTIFSDYEGQRIYFCCQRCRRQFEASPAKYLPNLVLTTTESTAHGHGDESPEDHHKNTEGQASSMAPPAVSQHADAEDDGHQHDHASDHALENEAGFGNRLLAWLGRFHPVIIHFPIALTYRRCHCRVSALGLVQRLAHGKCSFCGFVCGRKCRARSDSRVAQRSLRQSARRPRPNTFSAPLDRHDGRCSRRRYGRAF